MPRPLITGRWQRWVYFVAVLVVSLSAADYIFGANSDAMTIARETLQGSNALQQRIGSVRSVDLRWLWAFRVRSAYAGSKATLKLSIAGAKGSEDMVVDLQEIDGHWRVIRTSSSI